MGLREREYLYSCTCQRWLVAAFGDVTSQALPRFSADRLSEPQHLEQPSVKEQVAETMY